MFVDVICAFNIISPVKKMKLLRALIFLIRVSSIIILRSVFLTLLWCQFRCSVLIGTLTFIHNRSYFDTDTKYSVKVNFGGRRNQTSLRNIISL